MSIEVLRRIIVKQKQREEEKRVSRFDLANRESWRTQRSLMEEDGEEASRGGGSEVEEAGRADGGRGGMKRRRRRQDAQVCQRWRVQQEDDGF
ncbi:hypothetical protein YC2023_065891 [Brassica napus]